MLLINILKQNQKIYIVIELLIFLLLLEQVSAYRSLTDKICLKQTI